MTPARLLIVDDDADALRVVSTALQQAGYLCDEAATGQAALAAVDRHCPDVIISDFMMPAMNGIDLLRAIRHKACGSVFVLMTGHGSVSLAVTAIEEGADECLLKPIDIDALRELLERRGFYGGQR